MTTREVVLDGGLPWGFRMHGGIDIKQPLKISRVNPGSRAAIRGIREGDHITTINGESTKHLTNSEAHGLLRNAGTTLRLGLNEESANSPKKRQYRSFHQEIQQETVKKSTITSYSIEEKINEKTTTKNTRKENGSTENVSFDSVSDFRNSTLSSTSSGLTSTTFVQEGDHLKNPISGNTPHSPCYSNSSTPTNQSTLTNEGRGNTANMNDNTVSRSKKRRQRRKNLRKSAQNCPEIICSTNDCDNKDFSNEKTKHPIEKLKENYKVESPVELVAKRDQKKLTTKSKSLDDDEMVKIQELSETSDQETKHDNQPIISEASESEDNSDTSTSSKSTLSTLTLPLADQQTETNSNISPEDEEKLRIFLETLNLVTSPEEAVHEAQEKNTVENVKLKKAQKRKQLEQYFLPMCQNPRFLEAISEETSDISDREAPDMTKQIRKGTPELDLPPKVPPRTHKKRIQRNTIETKPILVDTKLVEQPQVISEGVCSTTKVKEAESAVEIVYLNDSSTSSNSPRELDDTNDTSSNEETISEENWSLETVDDSSQNFYKSFEKLGENESETTTSFTHTRFVVKMGKENEKQALENDVLSQLTPPPTPQSTTPKNELVNGHKEKIHAKNITDYKPDSEIEKITQNLNNRTEYTNILSPLRPPSADSDSSSDSSLCTAKYNPNSSIGDVTSITKDEELTKQLYQPLTLRETVLKYLMVMPFGLDIIQELAEVSKSIEHYASQFPSQILPKIPAFIQRHPNNDVRGVSVTKMTESKENSAGLPPVENNSNLLVYLSPKQKEEQEKTGKLLELHQKLHNRRSYQEKDANEAITNTRSRLLAIIKEEPQEKDDVPYFEESGPSKTHLDDRLRAKDLSEWLKLARQKSKSESNLSTASIPINNLRNLAKPREIPNRRSSLPQELYERQLLDIQEKERQIQRELEQLEEEKIKLNKEMNTTKRFDADDFFVSKKGDFAEMRSRPVSMPVLPTEFFRQQMFEEYVEKFTKREERLQQKVIRISSCHDLSQEHKEIVHPIQIEDEFMSKVKEKQQQGKLEVLKKEDSDQECEKVSDNGLPVIVIDGKSVKGAEVLPKHLREFVDMAKQAASVGDQSVWSPGQKHETKRDENPKSDQQNLDKNGEPVSPIWTPKSTNSSPTVERKEFRPVNFQSPVLSRRTRTTSETTGTPENYATEPPWKRPVTSSDVHLNLSTSLDRRIRPSQSTPGFGDFTTSPRLPKAQNPTITLLQKAREGQLPKGAHYIDQEHRPEKKPEIDRSHLSYPGEVLYKIKNEYTSESESEKPKKMTDSTIRKFEGIGPTTKDGMPLILRTEVKDKDQSKWYKRMYDTIHKQKPHKDEYVTVRYKQKRAQYPYTSGYLSEPEPGAYDSDFTEYKYQTLDRRRGPEVQEYTTSTMPRNVPDKCYSSSDIIKHTQPGRIENYVPGSSSISDKEAKRWWDEVMDIFDGHLEQQKNVPPRKSFINQALKESGYESDSTLVFRRKEEANRQLSPKEQKDAYKVIQKGGDVPLHGLRKPAPERPKEPETPPPPPPPKGHHGVKETETESPRKYVENEVTIHYKTPVRQEIKEYVNEEELARRQAEAMKKIYEEEKRRKYLQVSKSLQELHDLNSRRHTDNFIPSQKSPISLNRYDDFETTTPSKTRPRSPEPRLVARALYNFVGQTARELTFRKGDLIYVRRQVDKNWYEGELNAMVGLFPVNYVEIVPYDASKTAPRKSHEGQARAKYNFVAQTHLELSLAKGELVTITRRVDDNWFEGKIGGRKGIFPVSYVEVLIDAQEPPASGTGPTKPVAAPAAHSLLLNGSSQGKESMGSHLYTPGVPGSQQLTTNYYAKPIQITGNGTYSSLGRQNQRPVDQTLHIETQSEPIPYRALYKYNPQNDDELELLEGDTVYVLEKCDDGWYVGSSERTGAFGTFPGNYVEKI